MYRSVTHVREWSVTYVQECDLCTGVWDERDSCTGVWDERDSCMGVWEERDSCTSHLRIHVSQHMSDDPEDICHSVCVF